MLLDRDAEHALALVIDPNPTSRSIVASQLRELGVGKVMQASRLADGRKRLEVRRYDIVVCELHFPGEQQSGQELLDDLRRAQLLPYSTVFVMITGEARYAQVAEAAESALDSYLLKPFAATALAERLRQARHRKRELAGIFEAIESDDFAGAARLCLQRFAARAPYWLYAARIGAELLLRIGHHDEAQQLYQAIIAAKAVPWARLGVARAQAESGQGANATRTLETLLSADPQFADAYDVMGRLQLEQGQFELAYETYRQAVDITPCSIARLQKQGMLAYYLQRDDEAEQLLGRAMLLGVSSKMFDAQSLVLLAFVRFRAKDARGLQRCRENLEHLASRTREALRLDGMARIVDVLENLAAKRLATVVESVQRLAATRLEPEQDVEAACNLLTLLATLATHEVTLDSMADWVRDMAIRHSTSRSAAALVLRSLSAHEPFASIAAQAQAEVQSLSEAAMAHALDGRPRDSVLALLDHAERTLNAKFADTARRTLQRYRERIEDAADLVARIQALQTRYAASWAAPRLGQGARAAGGLTLRDGSPAAATLARTQARTDCPAPAESPAA